MPMERITREAPAASQNSGDGHIVESPETLSEVALDVFARLIELLAERRILDQDEVLELVEIAKRYMRE